MQNIQLRSIAEIMEEYSPVYPESKKWEDTIKYLLNEPAEKETVEILIQELKRDGKFREPILTLQNDEGDKYVGDGTHRLVAAYVAGYEEILTADDYFDDGNEELQNFTTLISSEEELDDDDIELIYDYLRSLKINDSIWITCGVAYQEKNKQGFYWDYDPQVSIEQINTIVKENLQRIFPHTVFEVETFIEKWEEDEEKEQSVWDEVFE